MTKDEALRFALEALQQIAHVSATDYEYQQWAVEAITAIKEALAQPEHGWTSERIAGIARLKEAQDKKLAQPEQEQLMSDQINYGMSVTQGGKRIDPMSIYKESEQKPVAAESKFDSEKTWSRCSIEHHNWVQSEPEKWPQYQTRLLYTTPPQRPSRSDIKPLTDEEVLSVVHSIDPSHQYLPSALKQLARSIEAAIWEKQK